MTVAAAIIFDNVFKWDVTKGIFHSVPYFLDGMEKASGRQTEYMNGSTCS